MLLLAALQRASRTRGPTGPGFTLAAAVLGFFVITLDAVVVNVALPSIRGDLGGGVTGLQWVVDGYVLTFAALLLTAGALSDRVGARRALAADHATIDHAYRTKYGRYGGSYVDPVVRPDATAATLRLIGR